MQDLPPHERPPDTPPPAESPSSAGRFFQFRLLDLFLVTALFAALFGLLRLLGMPAPVCMLISGLVIVCLIASGTLVYCITRNLPHDDE